MLRKENDSMKTLIAFLLVFGFLLTLMVTANAKPTQTSKRLQSNYQLEQTNTASGGVHVVVRKPVARHKYLRKPRRPGKNYLWIDSHYRWNARTQTYTHVNGYWHKHRSGYRYVPGKWQQVKGGYTWKVGVWLKL
jgi:hypothetical protein